MIRIHLALAAKSLDRTVSYPPVQRKARMIKDQVTLQRNPGKILMWKRTREAEHKAENQDHPGQVNDSPRLLQTGLAGHPHPPVTGPVVTKEKPTTSQGRARQNQVGSSPQILEQAVGKVRDPIQQNPERVRLSRVRVRPLHLERAQQVR